MRIIWRGTADEDKYSYCRENQRKIFKRAIAEYSKRLSRYCKLEIIEVADEKTPDNASETVEDSIRGKEGERLLKYIKDDAFVITLEIAGEQLTSEKFAEKINNLGIRGIQPYPVCDRRFHRTWERNTQKIRLCSQLFQNDIPTSADACDSFRNRSTEATVLSAESHIINKISTLSENRFFLFSKSRFFMRKYTKKIKYLEKD